MARLRPVRTWQHPRAPVRLIAVRGRVALRRVIRQALNHVPELFDVARAEQLLRDGRTREIIDALDLVHYREVLKAVFEQWARVFEAGAQLGARKINGSFARRGRRVRFGKDAAGHVARESGEERRDNTESVDGDQPIPDGPGGEAFIDSLFDISKALGDRFNFDRFDEDTQRELREAQDELIRDLEGDARKTIETVVLQGQKTGKGAASIVDSIRDVINLTDRQAQAVLNYEDMLRTLDRGALERQLRPEQFDAAFRAAREDGVPLGDAVIDEMVGAYESNYLDYRAETIARTESTRAANSGLHEAYRQAIDRGALPDEAVRRFWQVSLAENVCPICLSIPEMNPDGVGVGEDFQSEDGPQGNPPDPHPSCQCSVEYVTDLDLVPDDAGE